MVLARSGARNVGYFVALVYQRYIMDIVSIIALSPSMRVIVDRL